MIFRPLSNQFFDCLPINIFNNYQGIRNICI